MERLGEIKRGRDIGKPSHSSGARFILVECPKCHQPRWRNLWQHNHKKTDICRPCWFKETDRWRWMRGPKNPNWRGGKKVNKDGYTRIWLSATDPYYPMANRENYIMEHRLVMAKHLGRLLVRGELVHHINGVRDDNRIENLRLHSEGTHPKGYRAGYRQGFKDAQQIHDAELMKQIKLLRLQIRELRGEEIFK